MHYTIIYYLSYKDLVIIPSIASPMYGLSGHTYENSDSKLLENPVTYYIISLGSYS
jgi:hypothetical protein